VGNGAAQGVSRRPSGVRTWEPKFNYQTYGYKRVGCVWRRRVTKIHGHFPDKGFGRPPGPVPPVWTPEKTD